MCPKKEDAFPEHPEKKYNVCCVNCFKDIGIKNYIKAKGKIGTCSYCRSNDAISLSLSDVFDHIWAGIERGYTPLHPEGTHLRTTEQYVEYILFNSRTFENILTTQGNDGVFSNSLTPDCKKKLLNDLKEHRSESSNTNHPSQNPTIAWIDKRTLPLPTVIEEVKNWEIFKYYVKHFNRFIDAKYRRHSKGNITIEEPLYQREHLLDDNFSKFFESIPSLGSDEVFGKTLYRGRIKDVDVFTNLDQTQQKKELGPAPHKYSTAGRMNPAGISYFYATSEMDAVYSELRATLRDEVVIGEFEIIEHLNILNLTELPQREEESCFSEAYDIEIAPQWAFLRSFISEIQQPLRDDEHTLEYIPTQMVAEFIRGCGYDGLCFNSSLHDGGVNFVLFCGPSYEDMNLPKYGLEEVDKLPQYSNWLKLKKIYCREISDVKIRYSAQYKRDINYEDK